MVLGRDAEGEGEEAGASLVERLILFFPSVRAIKYTVGLNTFECAESAVMSMALCHSFIGCSESGCDRRKDVPEENCSN